MYFPFQCVGLWTCYNFTRLQAQKNQVLLSDFWIENPECIVCCWRGKGMILFVFTPLFKIHNNMKTYFLTCYMNAGHFWFKITESQKPSTFSNFLNQDSGVHGQSLERSGNDLWQVTRRVWPFTQRVAEELHHSKSPGAIQHDEWIGKKRRNL